MFKFSTLTMYWIQCFRVNILKNCSMFSMSQCFSMFLNVSQCFSIFKKKFSNFFDIFGQKGRLNFNFRTNFTLFIKNRKTNMGLNICLLWTIFCYLKMLTIFLKIPTLKHWNQHWNIENIESNSMLKFWKTLTSHWVSMFIFLTLKTLNWNQCQCRCRPLPCSLSSPICFKRFNESIVKWICFNRNFFKCSWIPCGSHFLQRPCWKKFENWKPKMILKFHSLKCVWFDG